MIFIALYYCILNIPGAFQPIYSMKTDKDLYNQLRELLPEILWNEYVPRFNSSSSNERIKQAALIRAVSNAFSESGTSEQKAEIRSWLINLLKDRDEKIRRYAIKSLPKLECGEREEYALLSLLRTTAIEREKKYIGQALEKIGGNATLDIVAEMSTLLPQTEQKVKASLARENEPSIIRMDKILTEYKNLSIYLRCRNGLEDIVLNEIQHHIEKHGKFNIKEIRSGLVVMTPVLPFSLSDIYSLRCFSSAGFFLGLVRESNTMDSSDELASLMASPKAQSIMRILTNGSIRYRMEFVGKGHQRANIRKISDRVFSFCPDILNDPKNSPWSMYFIPTGNGLSVELRPKLTPNPRFFYREDDINAASHPPLAASMARLSRHFGNEIAGSEIVWDPFCGSGLELIERSLLGGVWKIIGTDISPDAIEACRKNFTASGLYDIQSVFKCLDFRDYHEIDGFGNESISLIITNPPMGRRIRIPDLRGLITDLFSTAEKTLKPGGRLVFPNPTIVKPSGHTLRLEYKKNVDLGGFDCRLEMYVKQ
jgi:hypothetical protein